MRQFSLYAICLVLFLCGTISAQQALVEYKEKDDPCAPFKMRILVPGNHVDFKLRDQKLKAGIDYKMAELCGGTCGEGRCIGKKVGCRAG